MPRFVFNYFSFPLLNPKTGRISGQIYRPFVPIKLCYKHQLSKNAFNALLDSGCDQNLFPAELGELVGIRIKKGQQKCIGGIGGIKITAYTHIVKLFLKNYDFDTVVDFSYEQQVPLLGRTGFIDCFKEVTFKGKDRVFEIET